MDEGVLRERFRHMEKLRCSTCHGTAAKQVDTLFFETCICVCKTAWMFSCTYTHLCFETSICVFKNTSIGVASRSASPICVQVMNCNAGSKDAVGLLAYVPKIEASEGATETTKYEDAKHYVLQECIGQIIRCIENRSKHGFRCSVDGVTRLLFPRLAAMSLDTKERVKYFGQRSDRSCGFCRLRNGRSLLRGCKRQDPDILNLLFRWATMDADTRIKISQRARARASLLRHGWNYKKKCRLLQFASTCLVNVSQFPELPYGALCHFERMHTFFIAYCDYLMDLLVSLVLPDTRSKVKPTFVI